MLDKKIKQLSEETLEILKLKSTELNQGIRNAHIAQYKDNIAELEKLLVLQQALGGKCNCKCDCKKGK